MALATASVRIGRGMVRTGLLLAGVALALAACAPSPFLAAPGTATAPGAVPRDANGEPILKPARQRDD